MFSFPLRTFSFMYNSFRNIEHIEHIDFSEVRGRVIILYYDFVYILGCCNIEHIEHIDTKLYILVLIIRDFDYKVKTPLLI